MHNFVATNEISKLTENSIQENQKNNKETPQVKAQPISLQQSAGDEKLTLSKKKINKQSTPLQLALKDLQNLANRFGYSISRKKIKKILTDVFLKRFPNGTDIGDGKMSSMDKVKKASVITLNCAFKEWVKLDGFECVKQYLDQVMRDLDSIVTICQ